ncbi:MAG: RNA polymerase sigma-70 factor ECF, partial [Chitinophagaceae bacterium]
MQKHRKHMEDKEIINKFNQTATKNDAYTVLVKKYQEKLYWHIRRMVLDHDDANDVLQNTFLKIWNGLAGFKEHSQLYTWLYRIATNESLSFIEQQKRKSAVPFDDV